MASISDSAIIVLCIVAAGVAVLIGWSITHRIRSGSDADDERVIYSTDNGGTGAQSQWAYMRDARERYKEDIMARFGGHHHQRPRQQSYPMSGAPTTGPSDYSYS